MSFYRAVVADNGDPLNRGRVRLLIPQLFGNDVTTWADCMDEGIAPEAAPKPGERVWATFEADDLSYPIYLPSMSHVTFGYAE